jgi:poly-gamma-glutamate capsule biosynthesis protein CapA/YwtB (metallophosphatase superfamily)
MIRSRKFLLFALVACSSYAQTADPGIKDASKFDPHRPLAQELTTNVPDGFRLVAVGDCIISRPLSQYANREPAFATVVNKIKSADAAYGNLETSILDILNFEGSPYTGDDDVPLLAPPAVAKDLAGMGFDLMSRANNHALDWGIEGMRETSKWADDAGLATAGVGQDQALARAAHYYESSKGRIAIVSMASTFPPYSQALPAYGGAPGRPGLSSLAVKKTIIVRPEVLREITDLSKKLYPAQPAANDELTFLGTKFEAGAQPGIRYDMDPADLAGILKAVRQGKQHSDFLMVAIHSHEPANLTSPDAKSDFADAPAEFLHRLAKQAIDAGADAFLTTGIHHLGPIEIYKGRPIFYGLGNFFWSDIQEPMPADFYAQYRDSLTGAFHDPDKATDADFANVLNAESFAGPLPFESIITDTRFDRGRISEIRLYPIELGYGMKLTESGIPRVASAEAATRILKRVQEMSAPLGTRVEIEASPEWHSVGVIRP